MAQAQANAVALLALLAELWRWQVAGDLGKGPNLVQLLKMCDLVFIHLYRGCSLA